MELRLVTICLCLKPHLHIFSDTFAALSRRLPDDFTLPDAAALFDPHKGTVDNSQDNSQEALKSLQEADPAGGYWPLYDGTTIELPGTNKVRRGSPSDDI